MTKVTNTTKKAVKATSLSREAVNGLTRIGRNQAWYEEVFGELFYNAEHYAAKHGITWTKRDLKKIKEFEAHSQYILSVVAGYNWKVGVVALQPSEVAGIIDACEVYRLSKWETWTDDKGKKHRAFTDFDTSLFQKMIEVSAFTANKEYYWEMDTDEAMKFLTFRDQWLQFIGRVVNNF